MKVTLNCVTQPVLDMTAEEYIIYAARVSSEERVNNETAPKLLSYLIKHKHWSPFEMISIGIEIVTSRAIAQQILRHRSFSFQEFSQRYSEVTDMEPVQLRYQAKTNRQSSTDEVDSRILDAKVELHNKECQRFYRSLLDIGVAKECARMVLPLTTQTTVIMHGTLRSWIHFFEQRCDPHAQLEIQQIAFAAKKEIAKVCPWTAVALGWPVDPNPELPEHIANPTMNNWGLFELPIRTIQGFLDSDATDDAQISFTKGELKEYIKEGKEKAYALGWNKAYNSKPQQGCDANT